MKNQAVVGAIEEMRQFIGNLGKNWRCQNIATHGPNLDSITSVYLLREFGRALIPGIEKASVTRWEAGESPEGLDWRDWLKKGVIAVNVGLGPLDHHPHGKFPKDCSATLVARLLRITKDDLEFKQILEYVCRTDLKPESNVGGFSRRVKTLARSNGQDFAKTYQEVFPLLEAWHEDQEDFVGLAKNGYRVNRKKVVKIERKNHKIVLVVGETEDPIQFSRIARSKKYGDGAGTVIVKNGKTGHVQIIGGFGVDFRDITRLIRKEEMKVRALDKVTNWKLLEQEENLENEPCWFLFKGKGNMMLLNGSEQKRDVEPTRISLDKIFEIVKLCLGADHFPIDRVDCGGQCIGSGCRLYPLGLLMCRKARFDQHNNK